MGIARYVKTTHRPTWAMAGALGLFFIGFALGWSLRATGQATPSGPSANEMSPGGTDLDLARQTLQEPVASAKGTGDPTNGEALGGSGEELKQEGDTDTALPVPAQSSEGSTAVTQEGLPPGAVPQDNYFGLCVMIKNQQEDVREWILHYLYYFGVGKIYVYDNESDPPLSGILEDYVKMGRVVVARWNVPKKRNPMRKAFGHCLRRTRGRHTFVGLFDADEFLWQSPEWKAKPLREYLQQFEANGALALNWIFYGSSNHTKRPAMNVRKAYTRCTREASMGALYTKWIVRPELAWVHHGPHKFYLQKPHYVVDELGRRINLSESKTVSNTVHDISLHHYVLKSREDFEKKLARGRSTGPEKDKDWSFFEGVDAACNETCTVLAELPV